MSSKTARLSKRSVRVESVSPDRPDRHNLHSNDVKSDNVTKVTPTKSLDPFRGISKKTTALHPDFSHFNSNLLSRSYPQPQSHSHVDSQSQHHSQSHSQFDSPSRSYVESRIFAPSLSCKQEQRETGTNTQTENQRQTHTQRDTQAHNQRDTQAQPAFAKHSDAFIKWVNHYQTITFQQQRKEASIFAGYSLLSDLCTDMVQSSTGEEMFSSTG